MDINYQKLAVVFVFLITSHFAFSQAPDPSSLSVSSEITQLKDPDTKLYSYTVSGLGTTTEASDLISVFTSRPGIIEATVDLPVHKISVKVPKEMLESDIREVLKFAGKVVIDDPKLLTKYY